MASAPHLDPQHGLQPEEKNLNFFGNTYASRDDTFSLGMRLKELLMMGQNLKSFQSGP